MKKESKADAITTAARTIVEQERKAQDAKTARLKAARLAKAWTAKRAQPRPRLFDRLRN